MTATPRPHEDDLNAFRRQLAHASERTDAGVADLLTTGYAHVLELQAQQMEQSRRIDRLLESGDDDGAIAAARRQRALRASANALREELDALSAMRRPRRGGARPKPGP